MDDSPNLGFLAAASELAIEFARDAAERDRDGGTALRERAAIRRSGLLRMSIPKVVGGDGVPWTVILQATRILAQADGSLAQVFAFHHAQLATCLLFGTPRQSRALLGASASHNWFWGNAVNPLDRRLRLERSGGKLWLRGEKGYATGATDSDRLLVSAQDQTTEKLAIVVVPTQREGIHILNDWDSIGQRQTDSGEIRFDNVTIEPDEILGPPGPMGSTYATLRPCLTQLAFVNVYLGIAQGALAAAKLYVQKHGKPWVASDAARANADPYVLERFGNMWTSLYSVESLADLAGEQFQAAWLEEDCLTPERRGEVALTVAATKVLSSRVALDVTAQIFETMGASATATLWQFDRFWRNVRTLTLHDRLDYKVCELGQWALNDRIPTPSFYS